jgi:hypothetical protein
MRKNAHHELGLQAAIKYGISYQDAIPVELWKTKSGPLADFSANEWQDWTDETAQKICDLRELESWLQALIEKPKLRDLE